MLMRRLLPVGLLLLVILSMVLPLPATARAEEVRPQQVLLLYDSLASGTAKAGNIEALERLLAAFGVQTTVMSFDRYVSGSLSTYSKLIAIRNADDLPALPQALLADLESFSGGLLQVGGQPLAPVQRKLQLEIAQTGGADTLSLRIDQFAQAAITAEGIPYIVGHAGSGYGEFSSEMRGSVSPYGVALDNYAYIPFLVKGNLTELAASYVLKDWLAVSASGHYYVLLNGIYPFSDLDLLNETADRLYDAGIPFIASVQPVLDHLDYPAALRYLETLKHVQSRNGSIIVNAPVVASTIVQDVHVLQSQMEEFLDALAGYGIAPLGVGAEMYWSYDQHYTQDGLRFFDSSIVFANEKIMYRSPADSSTAFASNAYTVKAGELAPYLAPRQALAPLPMDTALVYPFPQSRSELEAMMQSLLADWSTFADYKNSEHTVRTAHNETGSRSGHLQINGTAIMMNNNIQEIQSEHTYVQENEKSFKKLFSVQNNIFIVLILVTLLLFAAFLIIGYRLYRQKYRHTGRAL
ncbi:hypothetical protein B5M42_000465 [Paenibacillus athensensis]|uniref:DUF2334 domain-containing protein n=1 Tax=Paenibacillus athensensis TaxID=1967502 RepID=A0A4Y8Q7C0_9BACL|nr:hypothetical protein [Paenibacillus athensensis]MCD1257308.1 hypothetical protein [Paenibacillus athensensis]